MLGTADRQPCSRKQSKTDVLPAESDPHDPAPQRTWPTQARDLQTVMASDHQDERKTCPLAAILRGLKSLSAMPSL